VQKGLNDINLY